MNSSEHDSSGNSSKKKIWITGASSGIGYELALVYANSGHTVIASARNADKLNELVKLSANTPGNIVALPLDVTNSIAVTDAVLQMQATVGIPDTAILNAGFYEPLGLQDLSMEHFEKTIDVNLFGVFRCLMALLPHYARGKSVFGGHLVLVSSVAGYSGLPLAAAYGTSKAALIHLAESLKHECNEAGIDISVVNPGFVKTPLTDLNSFSMPFMIEAGDAAERMYNGIEKRRFEITFPKRFTWLLKFLRLLPYPVYFAMTRSLLKKQ